MSFSSSFLSQKELNNLHWEPTDDSYISRCVETGKFHFHNEIQQYDGQQYETLEDCKVGLINYSEML